MPAQQAATTRPKFAVQLPGPPYNSSDHKGLCIVQGTLQRLCLRKGMHPPSKKRQTACTAIDEITFDSAARQEYLTGFHKRKLQRTKHAQETAERRARAERIAERKKVREVWKADLERHVQEANASLKLDTEGEESDTGDEVSEASSEWNGIYEPPKIDHKAEYIDEARFTSVTVEDMDLSKQGLYKAEQGLAEGSEDDKDREDVGAMERDKARKKSKQRMWSRETPNHRLALPKKKGKKFRYESKVERKLTRLKEKSKNGKQAKARRAGSSFKSFLL